MTIRKQTWLSVLALPLLALGCSLSDQTSQKQTEAKVLPVTTLITRDTVLEHTYVADIQAVRHVEIRARVTGFLNEIYVDEGQFVKKGQPLFKLNQEGYKEELARANANLETAIAHAVTAELEVDRVKLLVDKKVISPTELAEAKAKRKAAQSRIEEARSSQSNAAIRLSYTLIRAPFDGVIDRIPLKGGSLIERGTLLTTVSDVRSVYTYFNVAEGEYLEYSRTRQQHGKPKNTSVRLVLADGSAYPHAGEIETIEGEFDASTGSIAFRAHFPNPQKLLKHGATGTILLNNRVENALIVPQKAVFEIQDKNYVFVVDSANTVRMKNFVPRARFSHFYIVDSGLEPGDKIVYEGIQQARDGLRITPEFVGMDSLLARWE